MTDATLFSKECNHSCNYLKQGVVTCALCEIDRLRAEVALLSTNRRRIPQDLALIERFRRERDAARNKSLKVETRLNANLHTFVTQVAMQACSHGGDRNAPVFPCTPCAARAALGDSTEIRRE